MHDQRNYRHDQQEMNQSPSNVEGREAKHPHNQQNEKQSHEHSDSPWGREAISRFAIARAVISSIQLANGRYFTVSGVFLASIL
jgi:hypothetical protein